MLANVADELFRELAAGIELCKIPYNSTPDDLAGAVGPGRRIFGCVEIEGVFEIGNGHSDVAAEAVPLLLHGGGCRGRGRGRWVPEGSCRDGIGRCSGRKCL